MAKNPNISMLDHASSMSRCVNAENDSLRVEIPHGLEMSMELSHEDGDSVTTKTSIKKLELNLPADLAKLNEVLDVSTESKLNLYVKSEALDSPLMVAVLASPLKEGSFFALCAFKHAVAASSTAVGVSDLLAERIKLELSRELTEGESLSIVVLVS